ncbi:MAG: SIMPL domain-containing protein [Candidatus Pacebacteria bacterium]|nr:SIMPL domain-containing protein [Candidatus Paceibacterota bacterium]MCD8508366.1 SIMPL domain-containing protein [Candidatus Paceibacterota bacterium]MCD8528380.1 SIMPL domain-containing protein [Candidatus Paceibacterota bacterium]MCD8563678.1 SIMPL domain-containing protein [Candidatus Paceibacterota bacterium]
MFFKDHNTSLRTALMGGGVALLVSLTILALVATVLLILSITNRPDRAMTTITVEGLGEVQALPDIARISFSVEERGEDIASAQRAATERMADVLALVKTHAEERDIRVTGYSASPHYEWTDGRRVDSGFIVTQNIDVRVRDLEKLPILVGALGQANITSLFGPSFEIDDPENLKNDARTQALEHARRQAQEIADNLGVRLVRVVGFSEGEGYGYPMPRMAASPEMGMIKTADMVMAPELPLGENTVTARVQVTYKIR